MQPRRWRSALGVLCVVVLAGACSAAAGESDDDPAAVASIEQVLDATSSPSPAAADAGVALSDTPSPQPAPATDAPANAGALDFEARRLAGGTIDGTQLAGGDVVLWMWAPWCPQCNREAEHVAEALRVHGDEVTFVGMAGHDTDDAHRAFVEEHGLGDMLHVVDEDGSLWAQYGVSYQPAWVFIDEDGTTEVVAGGLYDDLDARLRALVDE